MFDGDPLLGRCLQQHIRAPAPGTLDSPGSHPQPVVQSRSPAGAASQPSLQARQHHVFSGAKAIRALNNHRLAGAAEAAFLPHFLFWELRRQSLS